MDTPTLTAVTYLLSKGNSDSEIAKLFSLSEEEVASLPHPPQAKKKTGKEEARQYIMDMSPSEKRDFFREIDPYKLWTMAEGAPETKIDVSQEPIRIDITHQLLKVYGPRIIDQPTEDGVLTGSEERRLSAGSSE
jgi:hypothetical protein